MQPNLRERLWLQMPPFAKASATPPHESDFFANYNCMSIMIQEQQGVSRILGFLKLGAFMSGDKKTIIETWHS